MEARAQSGARSDSRPSRPRKRRVIAFGLLAAAVVAGAVFAIRTVGFYEHHAVTDDAQIEAHIDPVLPRIPGYVTEVDVRDNEAVKAGQVLLRIETRDLQAKADTARGALENARAQVSVARANVSAARTASNRADQDLVRYRPLRQKEEISQQQFDTARAAADAARAQVEAAVQQVQAAAGQVAQKQADLDWAGLQLSYAAVTAPASGVVSKKDVEVGQLVAAGQPLMAIVEGSEVWVVANFKETQLRKMRVGQKAEFTVDAYPKKIFHGRVDSFSAATGAKFSLLPPDNATGNFTKVVQRIPVKIVPTDPADPQYPLRAGMSVNATVDLDGTNR
ncbi:MAG: HlyD family secretion protein [Thermoanaerobaculia bacterium]